MRSYGADIDDAAKLIRHSLVVRRPDMQRILNLKVNLSISSVHPGVLSKFRIREKFLLLKYKSYLCNDEFVNLFSKTVSETHL